MNLRQAIIVFLCCCGVALQSPLVSASSALELLGGFDRQRVQACYPVDDAGSAAEMAKLLYRLRGTNEEQLQKRVTRSTDSSVAGTPVPGDVVQVDGSIDAIKQYPLPEDLREYLEMPAFQEVVLSTEAGFKVSVFAPPLAGQIAKGDRISATAILVARADESIAYAAGRLAWYPKQPTREGWKLLAGVDFDLSLIAGAASRNRRVLEADDHDAFYGLLNASAKVQADSTFAGQNATDVDPVALLTKPAEFYGEWIEMDASTVRISQIAIDSAEIAQQLGQDHYFQIDASGDLGKKILQLQRAEGEIGPPIQMSGTYPITFVAVKLPAFLEKEFARQNALVALVSYPVSVKGFFYRLWSYRNAFMTKEGGGKQVGPLIVAATWNSRLDPSLDEPSGIAWFGYTLAFVILMAVVATVIWQSKNSRQDAAIRKRNRKPVLIDLPSDLSGNFSGMPDVDPESPPSVDRDP